MTHYLVFNPSRAEREAFLKFLAMEEIEFEEAGEFLRVPYADREPIDNWLRSWKVSHR